MVSTLLKNISQNGNLRLVTKGKIKNIWHHHPEMWFTTEIPEHLTARIPEPLTVDLIQQVVSPPPSRFNHNHKFHELFFSNKNAGYPSTPPKTIMEPENHPEMKRKIHLPSISILGFQLLVFRVISKRFSNLRSSSKNVGPMEPSSCSSAPGLMEFGLWISSDSLGSNHLLRIVMIT